MGKKSNPQDFFARALSLVQLIRPQPGVDTETQSIPLVSLMSPSIFSRCSHQTSDPFLSLQATRWSHHPGPTCWAAAKGPLTALPPGGSFLHSSRDHLEPPTRALSLISCRTDNSGATAAPPDFDPLPRATCTAGTWEPLPTGSLRHPQALSCTKMCMQASRGFCIRVEGVCVHSSGPVFQFLL